MGWFLVMRRSEGDKQSSGTEAPHHVWPSGNSTCCKNARAGSSKKKKNSQDYYKEKQPDFEPTAQGFHGSSIKTLEFSAFLSSCP